MKLSRRQFSEGVVGLAATLVCSRRGFAYGSEAGLRLGLNTFSLRALSHDEAIPVIIEAMKQSQMEDCELLSNHVEPTKFSPPYPAVSQSGPRTPPTPEQLEERKAMAAALAEWRLSAPMSYFEDIRATFEKQGLRIKTYLVRMGTSEEEIDRLFLMAKALGAETLNTRIPEALTGLVASAADRHRMIVGLQFSDVNLLDKQLAASKYFRIDPDIGDITKSKGNALEFVQTRYESISSLDLKDSIPGGTSVPFGEGESHLKEVLQFLKEKRVSLTAYIDCDYAGTGKSAEEVQRCAKYVRGVMA